MIVVISLLVIVALLTIVGSQLGWWSLAMDYLTGTAGGGVDVTVRSFTATGESGRAVLRWQTTAERNCRGFHLYRAESGTTSFVKVNGSLIAGKPPAGGSYRFNDLTVTADTAYDYRLLAEGQQGQQVVLTTATAEIP